MRAYLERDSSFWDASWNEDGEVTIVSGDIGGASATEVRSYVDEDEAREVVHDQVTRMCNEEGWAWVLPPEERWQPDATIAEWYEGAFFEELQRVGGAQPREPDDTVERIALYQGSALPAELSRFLAWRAAHQVGYTDYGEWRIWEEDAWLPSPEKGNLFEQLVLLDQQNYLGTAMIEYFASMVCLGSAGNGDVYFAVLDSRDPGRAEVLMWDHEEQNLYPFADGVSTLAWVNHVYTTLEEGDGEGDVDGEALARDMERVAERASLSWHYRQQIEESGVEPEYSAQSDGVYWYYRAIYLVRLLQNNQVTTLSTIGDLFFEDYHGSLDFEEALAGPYLGSVPATALYWLWRLFFFNKEAQLGQCIEVCKTHTSPLVRDAALLVEELQGGRGQLGTIEDIHALREGFLELDLDPERAEERAAEEAAAEAAAEVHQQAQIARARELVGQHDAATLAKLTWEEIGNLDVLDAIDEVLERDLPEAAELFVRVRALQGQHGYYNRAVDEVKVALTACGGLRIPRWLSGATPHSLLAAQAAMHLDDAAREVVRRHVEPVLSWRTDYHHHERDAVRALTLLGAADLLPSFAAMLDELLWDADDYIAGIKNKGVVLALIDALGTFGDVASLGQLSGLLERGVDAIVPRTLITIGRIGGTRAVEMLGEQLEGEHRRVVSYALALTASERAVDILAQSLEKEIGDLPLIYERVMLERARAAVGQAVDEALIRVAVGVIEPKKYEDIELQTSVAAVLPRLDDRAWAVEQATLLLHHEHGEVRDAALRALLAMDQRVTLRFADRPIVEAAFEEGGEQALIALLSDPHRIFLHNVLEVAAEQEVRSDAFVEAAVAWARRVPCRFAHYLNGYISDAHTTTLDVIEALATLEHPVADRFLGELLVSGNAMYAGADALKYDRGGAATRAKAAAPAPAELPEQPAGWSYERIGESRWVVGANVNGLAYSPDGQWLAVGSESGALLYDREGSRALTFRSAGGWIYDVAWHSKLPLLAVGAHGGHLQLLHAKTGAMVANLRPSSGGSGAVRKLAFSPSGQWLASASDDRTLRLWDVSAAVQAVANDAAGVVAIPHVWTYEDRADVNGVAWIDEDTLVIISDRGLTYIDREAQAQSRIVDRMGGADVAVDRTRGRVYAAGVSKVRVFDRNGEEFTDETIKQAGVARVRVGASGETIYLASWTGAQCGVTRVDVSSPAKPRRKRLKGHHDAGVFGMDLDPRTGEVCAAGKLKVMMRWSAAGAVLGEDLPPVHSDEISEFEWTARQVFSASDDGSVIGWDRATQRAQVQLQPSLGGRACGLALSEDEHTLVVSGSGGATAFNVDSGQEIWARALGRSEHVAVVGDEVIAADDEGLVWLSVQTGEEVYRSGAFAGSFIFYWARIDARRLACAGYDRSTIFIWDLVSRELLRTIELPKAERGGIYGMCHADGRLVISRWNKTSVVIDSETGALMARVHLDQNLSNPTLSPDGAWLLGGEQALGVFDGRTYQLDAEGRAPGKITRMRFVDAETALLGDASGGVWWARRDKG